MRMKFSIVEFVWNYKFSAGYTQILISNLKIYKKRMKLF